MYVDSGTDMTLVPRDFGRLLGMDLNQNFGTVAGTGGSALRVSLQSAEIRIGAFLARARIAVATRNDVPYLLGREGVFRLFKVAFKEYKGTVRFDRPR